MTQNSFVLCFLCIGFGVLSGNSELAVKLEKFLRTLKFIE